MDSEISKLLQIKDKGLLQERHTYFLTLYILFIDRQQAKISARTDCVKYPTHWKEHSKSDEHRMEKEEMLWE